MVRRLFIGTLIALTLGTLVWGCWLAWPIWREHSIRQHISKAEWSPDGPAQVEPPFWWPRTWRQEYRVRHKLLAPVTIDFVKTPLGHVAQFLTDYLGEPFVLDRAALEHEGVDGDTPVTICVQYVSTATALKLMLDDLNSTFVVRAEGVEITSQRAVRGRSAYFVPAGILQGAEQRNRTSLKQPVTLRFVQKRLSETVGCLPKGPPVSFLIDRSLRRSLVTIDVEDVPLEKALEEMLGPLDAVCVVEGEFVRIMPRMPAAAERGPD